MRRKSSYEPSRHAIVDRERKGSPEVTDAIRRYRTTDLFGDGPWIVIEHGNVEYRLRVTRLDKLILTK